VAGLAGLGVGVALVVGVSASGGVTPTRAGFQLRHGFPLATPVLGNVTLSRFMFGVRSAGADTTVDFEQFAPGTVITNQYADLGGPGQGVVFGPLPGGAASGIANPVIESALGQAQSGSQVANIFCAGCELQPSSTSGAFSVPRSRVSVYVGMLGSSAPMCADGGTASTCAVVTLLAFDSSGNQVAASAPATVTQGAGIHTLLSVLTPSATIVGFKITARDGPDDQKPIAIDDLSFDVPSAPPPPDFTLTPASTEVNLVQGSSATDVVAIGRLGGSSGGIGLAVAGALPAGVHAQFAPDPAGGSQSTLTLAADPNAPPTTGVHPTVTITGTPLAPSAGTTARSFTLSVGVQPAFDVRVQGSTDISLSSCRVSVRVEVTRALSFAGPVSLSVTGLPPGVRASFAPAQATFPNGAGTETITLTLTAPATGFTVRRRTATIHATAPPFGDRTATFAVGGTCPLQFDPQITSMQITQGTQLPFLPSRDPAQPGSPISYSTIEKAAQPGTLQASRSPRCSMGLRKLVPVTASRFRGARSCRRIVRRSWFPGLTRRPRPRRAATPPPMSSGCRPRGRRG